MIPIDHLLAAKQARDVVRHALIQALRSTADLSAEVAALLRADDLATEALGAAVSADCQIRDSNTAT